MQTRYAVERNKHPALALTGYFPAMMEVLAVFDPTNPAHAPAKALAELLKAVVDNPSLGLYDGRNVPTFLALVERWAALASTLGELKPVDDPAECGRILSMWVEDADGSPRLISGEFTPSSSANPENANPPAEASV
jgi:hypothetical protein